jgi:glutamate carboxypeptidase
MSVIIDLRDFCRGQREWLLETIEALVRLESPSTDKGAVDRCGAELIARLGAIGGRVTKLPRTQRGDHVSAEFSPARGLSATSADGASLSGQILLLGHFDTVWPIGQLQRMPIVRTDGRLHGPGVFDMKAGIAIAMLAVRAVLEAAVPLSRRVVMLWTTDEEIGSESARGAIEEEARRSDAVLVLEPSLPGGAVKTARKGCGQYEMIVRGVAAHAGIDPSRGASAIQEIAHQIGRVYELPAQWPGVSVNVGTISGGTRPNVVADEARAVIDVRAASRDEMDLFDSVIRRQAPGDPRTQLEISGGFDRPPMERTDAVARLYMRGRDIARELGFDLDEGSTGGGSDGNFTAALGVPTLDGLGAVGDGAHALHEHVEVDSLSDRAALVAGLLVRL